MNYKEFCLNWCFFKSNNKSEEIKRKIMADNHAYLTNITLFKSNTSYYVMELKLEYYQNQMTIG